MKILKTRQELQEWRKTIQSDVGFVPTMGALHAGHASLLNRARQDNETVILSIFVNPAQFNNSEDLKNYPNTWDADLSMAQEHGVSAIFYPKDSTELYPDDYAYQVSEKKLSKTLGAEGVYRPGHFDGMLTVVLKLFQLIKPKRTYFGEKDYEQMSLVRGMIDAFFLDIELVPCPTIREASGLALSSRNLRLSQEEIKVAPKLYEAMTQIADLAEAKKQLAEAGFKIDYLIDDEDRIHHKKRRYVAAWLGNVRLIDNVLL